MPDQAQLIPGTLDLLMLRALSLGPLHGYGVLLRIALGLLLENPPARLRAEHVALAVVIGHDRIVVLGGAVTEHELAERAERRNRRAMDRELDAGIGVLATSAAG